MATRGSAQVKLEFTSYYQTAVRATHQLSEQATTSEQTSTSSTSTSCNRRKGALCLSGRLGEFRVAVRKG